MTTMDERVNRLELAVIAIDTVFNDMYPRRLALGPGWQETDLVFRRADGSPLDPESVAKVFDRRVARSGLRRIRFHDLRHSDVAHLIAAGEQPLLIARRLCHASAAFTQDRYGHLFEDAGSQAATAVAAMVDGLA